MTEHFQSHKTLDWLKPVKMYIQNDSYSGQLELQLHFLHLPHLHFLMNINLSSG